MAKVSEIFQWMDKTYPFGLAEEYDNCGLLIGDPEREVSRCMLALDLTKDVLEDAVQENADLIITHHPVIFNPLKRFCAGDIPYECVRRGIAVISSHTCLDKAEGGVNDVLATLLSLRDVSVLEDADGIVRVGVLENEQSPYEFAESCKALLGAGGVRAVLGEHPVKTVGICSGAGGSFTESILSCGCDAYLTGEVKHHEAVMAKNAGITLVEAGHFETETVVLPKLTGELAAVFPEVEFSMAEANRSVMAWL
jgi:dinuclear metal center YbgI/SA1388 family protein